MRIFLALFFAASWPVAAQTIEVPHKMEFAGITLTIRDDARREIQKDVDALTASQRHFDIKAERAKIYFPIVEKIFQEEGLPDDFKYLALQESALIPDAVSSSKAVGFWQFKDYTAMEMGLRVDGVIDERLNIASSSRAAARYLIKNNQFFDNWVYALQSYQMGAGGVMKSVADTQAKATHMEITSKTYWYVKRFLANKIAFEAGVKGQPRIPVVAFENKSANTLNDLAKNVAAEPDALRDLNKWAKTGVIPNDKTYLVLLPVTSERSAVAAISEVAVARSRELAGATDTHHPIAKTFIGKINGIRTVLAVPGDNISRIAARGGVDLAKFLKWNDLTMGDRIVEGRAYFLGRKRLKAAIAFHKIAEGETLWSISQQYGVQVKRLRQYNRLEDEIHPAPGTMLFLASKRPKTDRVLAAVDNPLEVSNGETFDWSVKPEGESSLIKTDSIQMQPMTENPLPERSLKPADSLKILQTNGSGATLEDTVTTASIALPENGKHAVQPGETLYGIAKLYNMSVMDLRIARTKMGPPGGQL
jgi:membrane-bound lytic murein transglycosylase D